MTNISAKKKNSSYFLWIESKETTQIQKTNEGNLQGTTPEQCLITMNFLYVKKKTWLIESII